jgi:[ribosomal protein S18]-alanine N-acetyltransferase
VKSLLQLAPMLLTHVPQVLAIEQAAALHPWTEGIFVEELSHIDSRTYRVALIDGKVVGFGGVLVQVGEAHITNVAVADIWRRHGIARALMVDLMTAAIDQGALAATLEVRVSNTGAQKLYHRFGFAPAGARPRYYPDGEDALIMWAEDITGSGYAVRLAELAGANSSVRSA